MRRMLASLISLLLVVLLLAALPVQASAAGDAPVAENLDLKTYCNVSVGGMLSAFDPDGGALRFEITTDPVKGKIQLSEDGSFIYTPNENKKGKDYFGYKAVDTDGNYSQEATVIIQILKQKKAISYTDMRGRADEYAAVVLSEIGLFTGKQICGEYCFEPDEAVTRGDFLSMCMALTGKGPYACIYRTGYMDDARIPAWQKAYATVAAINGVYNGVITEVGSVFSGDEKLSYAEAALLLDHALQLENVSYISAYDQMDLSLAQACANLDARDMLPAQMTEERMLNRSDAALMLTAAYEFMSE